MNRIFTKSELINYLLNSGYDFHILRYLGLSECTSFKLGFTTSEPNGWAYVSAIPKGFSSLYILGKN
jgi:hypothetical protein